MIPSWNICIIIHILACSSTRYLKPIVLRSYHVSALRRVLGLQLDQLPQPFDYFPYPSPQHSKHDLDYHIFQLQVSLNACAHILSMLQVSIFYIIFYIPPTAMSAHASMMQQFTILLLPLHEMPTFMGDENTRGTLHHHR